jgi:hypothetical protein
MLILTIEKSLQIDVYKSSLNIGNLSSINSIRERFSFAWTKNSAENSKQLFFIY